jgi:PAS domain S-box-containing protein
MQDAMHNSPPEQLAKFFELSPDLFVFSNASGDYRLLNPAWEKILGYSLEEFMQKPTLYYVHPDDLPETVRVRRALVEGTTVVTFENRYLAKDGTWKWLSWNAVPQSDGSIYAVARDITLQKEDEKITQLLLRKLEQRNQELDQFAYIVSHDLKSPLRSIINLSEWIKEDLGDALKPEVAGQIDLLQSRVVRMQRLIEDLLQYAKTGRGELPLETVNLNQLLAEVIEGQARPVGFQILVPKPLTEIAGRTIELYQLFENLIGNAVKYRAADDGRVSITQQDEGDHWQFKVQDDGIGIDPKHHKRIFQVFQRLDAAEEIEGTGIGLALVQKIIHAMGGSIGLTSQEGKGSTFLFTWPK